MCKQLKTNNIFKYTQNSYNLNMNHDEERWQKKFEKYKIAQKCPRCGKIELRFVEGKVLCSNCGFEQSIGEI